MGERLSRDPENMGRWSILARHAMEDGERPQGAMTYIQCSASLEQYHDAISVIFYVVLLNYTSAKLPQFRPWVAFYAQGPL
jgi:hypothetical protein